MAINLGVSELKTQIKVDHELLFGLKRDEWSEAYLPIHVFEKFGLSQPAWFVIQNHQSSNPNEDSNKIEKSDNNLCQHVCMALIDP